MRKTPEEKAAHEAAMAAKKAEREAKKAEKKAEKEAEKAAEEARNAASKVMGNVISSAVERVVAAEKKQEESRTKLTSITNKAERKKILNNYITSTRFPLSYNNIRKYDTNGTLLQNAVLFDIVSGYKKTKESNKPNINSSKEFYEQYPEVEKALTSYKKLTGPTSQKRSQVAEESVKDYLRKVGRLKNNLREAEKIVKHYDIPIDVVVFMKKQGVTPTPTKTLTNIMKAIQRVLSANEINFVDRREEALERLKQELRGIKGIDVQILANNISTVLTNEKLIAREQTLVQREEDRRRHIYQKAVNRVKGAFQALRPVIDEVVGTTYIPDTNGRIVAAAVGTNWKIRHHTQANRTQSYYAENLPGWNNIEKFSKSTNGGGKPEKTILDRINTRFAKQEVNGKELPDFKYLLLNRAGRTQRIYPNGATPGEKAMQAVINEVLNPIPEGETKKRQVRELAVLLALEIHQRYTKLHTGGNQQTAIDFAKDQLTRLKKYMVDNGYNNIPRAVDVVLQQNYGQTVADLAS